MASQAESRWWYFIAGVIVLPVIWFVLFSIVLSILFTGVDRIITAELVSILYNMLALGGVIIFLLVLMFPIAIYQDQKHIQKEESGWQPNIVLYILGGILGFGIPLLQQIVGFIYLYKRHKYSMLL